MIGKLRLQYNLLSCISNPFEVQIDDLQLILGPSMSAVSNDDSFIHDEDSGAPYDQSNMYNIFTHNIKISKKRIFIIIHNIKVKNEENKEKLDKDGPVSEGCLFNILANMSLTINKLHIRYEDDYYAHNQPFAFGIICGGLTSTIQENEWHFGGIENSKFVRVMPKDPDKLLIREKNLRGIRIYWKSPAEMFIPLSLYESTKDLENQIFDAIPLEDLRHMMQQSFSDENLLEEFSLFSSIVLNTRESAVEEAKSKKRPKIKAEILLTKVVLNISPQILSSLCTLREYTQNLVVMHELKNYRPKRRPLTDPEEIKISEKLIGPIALEKKRRLIVRDWFFFAVWAIRIKNLIKNNAKSEVDQEMKMREFNRLYSKVLQRQHKPLQEGLKCGLSRQIREDNIISLQRDVDDYLFNLEAKIALTDDPPIKLWFAKISKAFADSKLSIRFQELSLQLFSNNSASRMINNTKKPSLEFILSVFLYDKSVIKKIESSNRI